MAKRRQPTSLLAMVLVAGLAIGVWWLNGGEPGTPTASDPGSGFTSARSGLPTSTGTTTPLPSPGSTPASTRPTPAPPAATEPASGLPFVYLGDLPPEATETVELIDSGGPYPYEADDDTFGNYEGLLPGEDRGFYREYTVETPGSSTRGARRVIAAADDVLYWTADHYDSFAVIKR